MARRSGGPILGDALAAWDAIQSVLPHLENEATVTVTGNPRATRRELYFLAAATGFALAKRYDVLPGLSLPPSILMVEWDAGGNTVKFYVKYRTNLFTSSLANPTALGGLTLYTGPPETVYGAAWSFNGALSPGTPAFLTATGTTTSTLTTLLASGPLGLGMSLGAGSGSAIGGAVRPTITVPAGSSKWEGRPILTRESTVAVDPDPRIALGGGGGVIPAANPRPAGDYRSRGSLYNMVYSALTTPQGAGYKISPDPQLTLNNSALTGL